MVVIDKKCLVVFSEIVTKLTKRNLYFSINQCCPGKDYIGQPGHWLGVHTNYIMSSWGGAVRARKERKSCAKEIARSEEGLETASNFSCPSGFDQAMSFLSFGERKHCRRSRENGIA